MAYSHQLHFNGASGQVSEDGPEYDAVYRVITDDADDQAQKVIEWFTNNVVSLGDQYDYANDSDPFAVAKTITPERDKKSTAIWLVTVHYAPIVPPDSNFEVVIDILPLECQDVTVQTVQYSRPTERAKYRGGFVGTAATRIADGDLTIPVNSAFVPFNPGLEQDDANMLVRVVRKSPTVDGNELKGIMNALNSEPFTLFHCGMIYTVLSWEARIRDVGPVSYKREDGIQFWEVPISFEIQEGGWFDEVADRGVLARATIGDDDGRGGSVSQSDIIPGVPKLRHLVDLDETPLSDPILFNGDGGPLDISSGVNPVWIRYQKYVLEFDYRGVTWFSGLIS